jgi:hypothetical protein
VSKFEDDVRHGKQCVKDFLSNDIDIESIVYSNLKFRRSESTINSNSVYSSTHNSVHSDTVLNNNTVGDSQSGRVIDTLRHQSSFVSTDSSMSDKQARKLRYLTL